MVNHPNRSRRHYAFVHSYGGNIRSGDNARMGLMVAFASATERDAWVARGHGYRTEYRYREAIEAGDPDIARHIDNTVMAADLPDLAARLGWPLD